MYHHAASGSATTRSCDRLAVGDVADDRFRLGLERRNGVERWRRDGEMHAFGEGQDSDRNVDRSCFRLSPGVRRRHATRSGTDSLAKRVAAALGSCWARTKQQSRRAVADKDLHVGLDWGT
jgi:hypothetical protein